MKISQNFIIAYKKKSDGTIYKQDVKESFN
jgi:hypothetical protein